ncbi:hypothetical protein [Caballeronia udeis]|uniref:hypothetical protein n=1 Tax=Caballeronia udeis TaxID=1232866 RepID=UPI000784D146|nr:hypothetical protein [Caballeronia udeis]
MGASHRTPGDPYRAAIRWAGGKHAVAAVLIANALTRNVETQLSLSQRCGVYRQTIAMHAAIIDAALVGTRCKVGEWLTHADHY